MTVRIKNHQTAVEYFGLTCRQWDNLPVYVQDSMESAYRDHRRLTDRLAISEGIKPLDHMEALRMEGIKVETDVGTYVFPWKPRTWGKRGEVTLQTPLGDQFTFSFREDRDEGCISLNLSPNHTGRWRNLHVAPEASNAIKLLVREER